MEFITIVHPAQSLSAEFKRQAHSHAARVAHARARKVQVAHHIEEKKRKKKNVRGTVSSDNSSVEAPVAVARQHHNDHVETTPVTPRIIPGAFEHETLASFIVSLTTREQFLFHYYINVVVPQLCLQCPILEHLGRGHRSMRDNWVLYSSTDTDLLKGFLLAACRHLSVFQSEEEYTQLALQYKLSYVQSLREVISMGNPSLSRVAVARAMVLVFDEITLGDITMASNHVLGIIQIIKSGGGPQAVGLSDFLQMSLNSCIYGKRLLDWNPVLNCDSTFAEIQHIKWGYKLQVILVKLIEHEDDADVRVYFDRGSSWTLLS
ncbi:hypothetical protein FZEAL_9856 [Fusarium zealandicum]|uniref:Uncharacterized protein n=1 Tax=Fusarium zealandicum TaxID=1053134 RepID=A0A8H4XEG8_9HYPO|nr:hypothetical protein FZEAL_9856 [Fusarium zealandicum]